MNSGKDQQYAGSGSAMQHQQQYGYYPQPGQYGQQPQIAYGVGQASVQVVSGLPPPATHLGWSIANTILLCLPLGIAAIICSVGVANDIAVGRVADAQRKSAAARALNISATVIGSVLWVVGVVLVVLTYTTAFGLFRRYSYPSYG